MPKRILILRFSDDVSQEGMVDIKCHAAHYAMEHDEFEIHSMDELRTAFANGNKYDYLYIAGHGSDTCFGDHKRGIYTWADFGSALCQSECLKDDAILMLYCCRGGLNKVAYTLFAACPNIQYICGAKQGMRNIDLLIGFNVFVYNIECRNIDPILAAEKATLATENRFKCFDRLEVETEPMYYYHYCPDCVKIAEDTSASNFEGMVPVNMVAMPPNPNN